MLKNLTLKIQLLVILLISTNVDATPKITVTHQRTQEGFAQAKVFNETMEKLICHVAIDGHKILFTLLAQETSTWYVATDKRYNHQNFSVWCDYISLHPQYEK